MEDKNVLDKAIVYLAGAIDKAADDGVSWRRSLRDNLKNRNINVSVLDPTDKLICLTKEIGFEKQNANKLKKEHKWDELRAFVKNIVRQDLRCIDSSDIIIAYIDPTVHSVGTYHELVVASLQKKPILIFVNGGKENTPTWLFGIIDHNNIFDNSDELLNYLEKVNNGEVKLDSKWVLFRRFLNI